MFRFRRTTTVAQAQITHLPSASHRIVEADILAPQINQITHHVSNYWPFFIAEGEYCCDRKKHTTPFEAINKLQMIRTEDREKKPQMNTIADDDGDGDDDADADGGGDGHETWRSFLVVHLRGGTIFPRARTGNCGGAGENCERRCTERRGGGRKIIFIAMLRGV